MNDVQPDHSGTYVAVACDDHIGIYTVSPDNKQELIAKLQGHEGPVWRVSWANPKHGAHTLASCSYDQKVTIWSEVQANHWEKYYEFQGHSGSVNGVAFAPVEYGFAIASASSDETVCVLRWDETANQFVPEQFTAHTMGCNSVSWEPTRNGQAQRLVSGGSDHLACVWRQTADKKWEREDDLKGHRDWVRDAQWCPDVTLPFACIASGSQDGSVCIWTKSNEEGSQWVLAKQRELGKSPVWRVSWNLNGNTLAVSSGDGTVTRLVRPWETEGGADSPTAPPAASSPTAPPAAAAAPSPPPPAAAAAAAAAPPPSSPTAPPADVPEPEAKEE